MTAITLQAATAEPGELAAGLIYDTAPALFDFIFGGRAETEQPLVPQWRQANGFFSHHWATMAYGDGGMVGLELGFNNLQKDQLLADTVSGFQAAMAPDQLMPMLMRMRQQSYLTAEFPEEAYYLQSLSVIPEGRGQGWGKMLLHNAFAEAKQAGLSELHLDVLADNPAVSFYLGNGMECQIETRMPVLAENHDIPTMYRMVKML